MPDFRCFGRGSRKESSSVRAFVRTEASVVGAALAFLINTRNLELSRSAISLVVSVSSFQSRRSSSVIPGTCHTVFRPMRKLLLLTAIIEQDITGEVNYARRSIPPESTMTPLSSRSERSTLAAEVGSPLRRMSSSFDSGSMSRS